MSSLDHEACEGKDRFISLDRLLLRLNFCKHKDNQFFISTDDGYTMDNVFSIYHDKHSEMLVLNSRFRSEEAEGAYEKKHTESCSLQSYRSAFETIFEQKGFMRPLFYSYAGSLRFMLSSGETQIEMLLTALETAKMVCDYIFKPKDDITVCVRIPSCTPLMHHRGLIKSLKTAGIIIPKKREIWFSMMWPDEDEHNENPVGTGEDSECIDLEHEVQEKWFWINLFFPIDRSLLQNFLWCAIVKDLGTISPRPTPCDLYLINFKKQVLIFPYDDRGMDIAGPNHNLLLKLYREYKKYLLKHDLKIMNAFFLKPNRQTYSISKQKIKLTFNNENHEFSLKISDLIKQAASIKNKNCKISIHDEKTGRYTQARYIKKHDDTVIIM